MRLYLLLAFLGISILITAQTEELIQYVNPFVGTQRMGHTYPGATLPFGAVQLSPDTDTIAYEENGQYNRRAYEYCAGYQYDDPTMLVSAIPILAEQGIRIWAIF